jgi:hypothetical protein
MLSSSSFNVPMDNWVRPVVCEPYLTLIQVPLLTTNLPLLQSILIKSSFKIYNKLYRKQKKTLKRSYVILIAGGVLLVAGLVISALWVGSFAGRLLKEYNYRSNPC